MEMAPQPNEKHPHQLSTGAGIAIAGIWLAGSAVTIVLLLIFFVIGDHSHDDQVKMTATVLIVLILLIAAPMIVAYNATKMILNKD
jgi:drug/metabolite transporter (DMT)-like permease